jgi:periplasmic divalent cation tolerance protein
LDEARKVCRILVQERLIACAQIIPWIESIYIWDSKLETTQESKVILKALESQYGRICELIEKNCSYEVPEITFMPIAGVNPLYQAWLEETLATSV